MDDSRTSRPVTGRASRTSTDRPLAGAPLSGAHAALLAAARTAVRSRQYFSAFPESPSTRVYGETPPAAGQAAYEAWLGQEFPLTLPVSEGTVATERSPYGPELGVRYRRASNDPLVVDALMGALRRGLPAWRDAGPHLRTEVCLTALDRLHDRVFELAHAVMHTTGQPFVMAFQAGGAHALDRALEAIALAFDEMTAVPVEALWEKALGRSVPPVQLRKTFTVTPRGVSLVIGCRTFPTWNSWPGLFASLVTGNPVLVKPHPAAVLPLAITVQVLREVLQEAGFDADLAILAPEKPADRLAAKLAVRPEVAIVDFTGSSAFGAWLEDNARQARVFAEKAGVNPVVIESTGDFRGMCANLAFSISLYSGQMCTAPQNLFVPRGGIETDEGRKSAQDVARGIAESVEHLLNDDARAVEVLGAVADEGVLTRLAAAERGNVILASRTVKHPAWPDAVVRTPAIVRLDAEADRDTYAAECFGPVSYVIETANALDALRLVDETVRAGGAMTAAVYSTSEPFLEQTRMVALDAGVSLSENLTGGIFVNQSAAFSDFHGSAANPAANASLTDAAFVTGRFHVVQSRRPA